jgi:CRISPR-associated protein Cmr3
MGAETRIDASLPEGHVWVGLWIEPLDVLFFRDGKPFNAATRAEGGLPQPRTLAGALRTAILSARGFDFAKFGNRVRGGVDLRQAVMEGPRGLERVVDARFRGPWLARWDQLASQAEPLLSAPASLYRVKGSQQVRRAVKIDGKWEMTVQSVTYDRDEIFRADPLPEDVEVPGWALGPETDGRRPLWRRQRGKPRRVEAFVRLDGIKEFLAGRVPALDHLVSPHELYDFDHRVGVAIDADSLTGLDSQLFATRMLSLREGVGIYGELSWPAESSNELEAAFSAPFPLGGEGRYARAKLMGRPVSWPEIVPAANAVSVYLLATAGIFGKPGELRPGPLDPDRLRDGGMRVLASASTGAIAVSGWDVARNAPRPTRFAAPAGTIYFVKSSSVPGQVSLCGDGELVAEGWGFAIRGVTANDR